MKKLIHKLFTTAGILKKYGVSGVKHKLISKSWEKREKQKAERWLELHGSLIDNDREEIGQQIENFSYKPLISIITPVYDVEEKYLRRTIESVLKQLYQNWELCIVDDCSPSPHVKSVLEEYAAKDKRVKAGFRETNGHISAASNTALELAAGEFAALLDHDDELSEDALFFVVKELNDFPAADMLYSDEDTMDENSRRSVPKFKPDWSQDLFYSVNYVTHLAVYRMEILRQIGGFRRGFEGSQDYDLALRVIEQIPEKSIRHIPRILYHWRAITGSVALSGDEKPYAHERARKAIRSHLARIGKKATVSRSRYNLHRVQYVLREPLPKVSVIINGSVGGSTGGISEKTKYPNVEIVVAEAASGSDRLNRAVSKTGGEIVCFLDFGLSPSTNDWLTELVGFACQDEIGAIGAKILSSDGSVRQGGIIVGMDGLIGTAHKGFPGDHHGNMGRNHLVSNFSAVSTSCMAIRREVFEDAGGFDAENLPNTLFDIDLCLRLRQKGYRIVVTPFSELMQIAGQAPPHSVPTSGEVKYFTEKWKRVIERDPFYNPNLSKKDGTFSIDI
jgi:glycosyltransferase involved in cell wall biosynthesis